MSDSENNNKLEKILKSVQVIAIISAGIWALYTFIFKSYIEPAQIPPQISLTSKIEKIGAIQNLIAVKITFTLINHGASRVKILSSWYNIYGVKVQRCIRNDSEFNNNAVKIVGDYENLRGPMHVQRFAEEKDNTVVCAGKLLLGNWWFDPGEEYTLHFTTYLPRAFDKAKFKGVVIYAKDTEEAKQIIFEPHINPQDNSIEGNSFMDDGKNEKKKFDKDHNNVHKALARKIGYSRTYTENETIVK